MAFPLQRGLTPPEIEFLSEMELVTVVPRQRLEGLELLSVSEICTPHVIYFIPRGIENLRIYIPHSHLRYEMLVIRCACCVKTGRFEWHR